MDSIPEKSKLESIYVIVNFGLWSKVIRAAKRNGITGGINFLGKGTVDNCLLKFLGIADIRKEIF